MTLVATTQVATTQEATIQDAMIQVVMTRVVTTLENMTTLDVISQTLAVPTMEIVGTEEVLVGHTPAHLIKEVLVVHTPVHLIRAVLVVPVVLAVHTMAPLTKEVTSPIILVLIMVIVGTAVKLEDSTMAPQTRMLVNRQL